MLHLLAQRTADQLMKSAQRHHSVGVLAAQAAAIMIALIFFYGAYTTHRDGFKVSEKKTIQGNAAKLLAAALTAIGIGIIVFAVFFLPGMAY